MITDPAFSIDEPTIRLEGINHGYISGDNVLADINIELSSGSFSFLTGPSGSGKTTLLQLLYAAQKPRTGRAFLFGVNTSLASRKLLTQLRRRIGVVYQDFRLLDHLTAYENAALPLRVTGSPNANIAMMCWNCFTGWDWVTAFRPGRQRFRAASSNASP